MKEHAKFAFDFLCKRNPFHIIDEMTQIQYVCHLLDFQKIFGDEGIIALAGFYLYAIKEKLGDEATKAIKTTFVHDLKGMHEKGMLPRSSAYGEVFMNEFQLS